MCVVDCFDARLCPKFIAKHDFLLSAACSIRSTPLADVGSLSEAETTRVRCRLGQIFQARKSLVLTTLREAGATDAELAAAGRAIDDISAAMCSGASVEAHERALGEIFVKVNDRLTAGTTLAGRNVTLDAFEDLMREMMEHCFNPEDAISFKDLAGLTDTQFDARLDKLAFGSCGGSPGSGGISGLPDLPAGSDSSGYAQCVREAFREGVTRRRMPGHRQGRWRWRHQ